MNAAAAAAAARSGEVVSRYACALALMRKQATRLAPPAVAIAILVGVVVAAGPSTILASMAAGAPLQAAPFAFALAFMFTPLQSIWDRRLFARTPRPPSYFTTLSGKAATSTLSAVGPLAGTGGYAVWIARATGAGAASAAALALTISLSDLGALGVVATVTSQLGGAAVPRPAIVFAACAVGVVVAAAIAARIVSSSTGKLAALRSLSAREVAIQVSGRTLAIGVAATFHLLGARAFGLDLPFAAALGVMPLLLFVTVLPVNLAGFGAAQAAWALMLRPWAEPADVVAFHLTWSVALNMAYVVRGLPFLRKAMRDARLDGAAGDGAGGAARDAAAR